MKYIVKDLNSFKLHLIKTKKFKTNVCKVIFRRPISKDIITGRSLLSQMLLQSSKNYHSKRELAIKTQDLYAAEVSCTTSRVGNYLTTTFRLGSLNDKYTEKGNFKESIKFLGELIFNPDINDDKFDDEKLDIIKSKHSSSIKSIKEDADSYSLIRLFEEMESDASYAIRPCGYLEDMDSITSSSLYDVYRDMIDNNIVDIFVLGDFDDDEITELIKDTFKFRTIRKYDVDYSLEDKKALKIREFSEEIENSQSKLAIGCRLNNLSDYERNYVLSIFNVIFGGCSDSKLFQEVREKNSLCYTIYSVPNKLDKLLLIRAGIDRKNYSKTISIIKKDLEDMKKGLFNEDDIDVAKEYYYTALDSLLESPGKIIDDYFMMELIGTDSIDVKREKMGKVTKEEIIKVAKKISFDSIFLLEGVNDEEDRA